MHTKASTIAVACVVAAAAVSCRSCDACVEAADDTSASDDKFPSPWPVKTTSDALQPLTVGRGFTRTALVPQSAEDVATFFQNGLAACHPTRAELGGAAWVACSGDDGEVSVLAMPNHAGEEARAGEAGFVSSSSSSSSRILLRWQRPRRAAAPVTFAPIACGPSLRFLAPPASTEPRFAGAFESVGDEGELGTCAFLTSLDAGDALKTMFPLVFKGGMAPVIHDGRYTIYGYVDGVYWRLDTAPAVWKPATLTPQAPVASSVLVMRWDPNGVSTWPANRKAGHAARVAGLEKCTKPCAAALATDGKTLLENSDGVGLKRWSTLAQRCEYACDGEPGAPAGIVAVGAGAGAANVWLDTGTQ